MIKVIVLRNEQLDFFRAENRKKLPDIVRRGLVAQGLAVQQQGSALVLRDSRQHPTCMTFQPDGLPDSIVRPSGLAYGFEYDDAGRLAAVNYPGGRQLLFSYDTAGNVTALAQPGFAQYQLSYADSNRLGPLLERLSYPDGRTREFSYDDAGRVTSITEPSGASYDFERNEQGHLSAIIDPLLREIELISDDQGALLGVEFPDGSLEAYLFDEEAQTAVRVHRDGTETHYLFDNQERLAQLVSGADGATNFAYDAQDNLIFVEQGGQRISYRIEGDNTAQEHCPDGTVSYDYDGDGRLTGLRNPFGDSLRYVHDADGRLAAIQLWDGRSIQITSTEEDLISSLEFPGGVVVRQQFGPALRLSQRQVQTAQRVIQEVSYRYDDSSRFTGCAELTAGGQNIEVSYDVDDHVVGEVIQGRQVQYAFDIKGNLLQIGQIAVTVGPMDEPTSFGDQRIDYDARGNMLRLPAEHGWLACKYRHDGLLTECRTASDTVTFRYDALGRRIEKRSQGQIWRYGWTGQQLLWEEHKPTENATPLRRDYLFLPGTTLPLGFREQGRCYWLMTDCRGAVDLAVDEQGQVVWKASYDSFGRADIEVNEVRQPWRLQGQYADDETGLYYNFARYYSPHLRSYLSLDPRWIEFDASHYSYCRNDPWNRADPLGGLAPLLVIGIAGIVGGVVGGITAVVTGGDPLAGAIEGAVAGAGAVVAVVAGASAAVVIAAGVVATGVGALAGKLTEQVRKGDKFSIKCALLAAGLAAATDLALLGLGKIPGVKQLAKVVGKKLAKLLKPLKKFAKGKINKASGLLKRLKGRLKKDTGAVRKNRRLMDRKVKESTKQSKLAARAHPNGIHKKHVEVFKDAARDNNSIYIVRAGNPDSVKFQGKKGYTAKPVTCKAKTAKFGPDAGLVVNPNHETQKAYWDAAERSAGSQKKLDEIKKARRKAQDSWKDFEKELNTEGTHYKVDTSNGQVLFDGDKIHGDYDLHGVYDVSKKNVDEKRIDFGSGKGGDADVIQAKRREDLNSDLGGNQIQHGGQDDWMPKKGKIVEADPPVTVFMPDGTVETLADEKAMEAFYKANDLPWPYPRVGV